MIQIVGLFFMVTLFMISRPDFSDEIEVDISRV